MTAETAAPTGTTTVNYDDLPPAARAIATDLGRALKEATGTALDQVRKVDDADAVPALLGLVRAVYAHAGTAIGQTADGMRRHPDPHLRATADRLAVHWLHHLAGPALRGPDGHTDGRGVMSILAVASSDGVRHTAYQFGMTDLPAEARLQTLRALRAEIDRELKALVMLAAYPADYGGAQ